MLNGTSNAWGVNSAPQVVARGFTYPGIHHRRESLNNQDAFAVSYYGNSVVAVVSDGCGSGSDSEVGSKLISNWFATHVARLVNDYPIDTAMQYAKFDLYHFLSYLTELYTLRVPNNQSRYVLHPFIFDQLRFTLWCLIVKNGRAWLLSAGDGAYKIDDNAIVVTEQNNDPKYPIYGLTEKFIGTRYEAFVASFDEVFRFVSLGDIGKDWNRIAIMVDGAIPMWKTFMLPLINDASTKYSEEEKLANDYYQRIVNDKSMSGFITNQDDMTACIIERV